MRVARSLPLCALALGVSGCNIHPIPYDKPGYRTIDIVKKIRCETKRALDKFAQSDELKRGIYDRMSVGYKFTFTISENNSLGGSAGFRLPFTGGTFTLGIASGAEKERVGERDFTIIDSFREARDPRVCEIEADRANYAYPITGVIGLEEVIRTYLELQAIGLGQLPGMEFELPPRPRFAPKKQEKEGKEGKTEEFVETFEFTTTLRASASPEVRLSPAGSNFRLTDASLDLAAERKDKHRVIVTLAPNYRAALMSLNNQDVNSKLRQIENAVRFVPLQ